MAATRARVLILVLLLAAIPIALAPPPVQAAGSVVVYATGLGNPIALAFAPDGRVFYAERNTGTIRAIVNGSAPGAVYYTLSGTALGGERGLLGLALDPAFPTSPYVYAYQTYNDAANGTVYNRVLRIEGDAVGTSHSVIAQFPPVANTNHNGGVIAFGPDGKLYVVVGEDAIPAYAQDLTTPKGKVLRMNPDGSAPTDNPFFGIPTVDDRIYTFGHRNMFGLAFHPVTQRAFVTENGPTCNDEINLLAPGANFGWGPSATCTGPSPGNTNRDGPSPIEMPLWWWTPTICPTNAAIYGGPFFPAWRGDLFMGDCNTRTFRRLDLAGPNYDTVTGDSAIWTAPSLIFDVESGPDGAIWFTTTSTIYRYVDTARPPVADFVAAPDRTIPGADITFDASASADPDGFLIAFDWDFGDGVNGTGMVTTHAYGAPGTYLVTLTVTDNETLTDTATRTVTIDAPPGALFTATPSPAEPGEVVTFDASASNASGRIVSYAWDFGDGGNGTGQVAMHAYGAPGTYTVTLRVVDNASLSDTDAQPIRVNAPPEPVLAVNATQSFMGVPLRFDGSSSSDPDGSVTSFAWDFGDGGNATGATATHAYASRGTFTVTLTVVDNDGRSNGTTRVVSIVNRPPRIVASSPTVAILNALPGAPVTLSVVATDPDADVLVYAWTVDGAAGNATGDTFSFSSDEVGTHTVAVTVSDGAESVSHEWTVHVLPRELPAPNPWVAGLIAGLLAAGVALLAFFLWRRRRRRED